MNQDSAFDFPCSRTYRAYEAWLNEGIDLPSIEVSRPDDSLPIIDEVYVRHHPKIWPTKLTPKQKTQSRVEIRGTREL